MHSGDEHDDGPAPHGSEVNEMGDTMRTQRPPTGSIVMTVLGALIALLAIGILLGGALLMWANATQRDSDGYFNTRTERLDTGSYAITSEEIDLGSGAGPTRWDLGDVATVRIDVDGAGEAPVFVGIGPTDEVEDYLRNVSHAEVRSMEWRPFRVDYKHLAGSAQPEPPVEQDFWAASADGVDSQRLEWELEGGRWSVVIMNADAARGVNAEVGFGAKVDWIVPIAITLLVVGGVILLVGTALLVGGILGLSRRGHVDLAGPAAPPVAGAPPVRLTGRLDEPLNRWLWLVKWLLLIPHFVVLLALWIAFFVVTVVAFFAILFTGRYPRGLWEFNVGVIRWSWRVAYYGYGALGTDRYPPFTLGHVPGYPASLEIDYPAQLSRGLVLVKWWLLAIPHYLILGLLGFATSGWEVDGRSWQTGGLGTLLVFIVGVALLFTARYPVGLHRLLVGIARWVLRVSVYALLLRDEYPPFRLDQGPEEPTSSMPPPPQGHVGQDDRGGAEVDGIEHR